MINYIYTDVPGTSRRRASTIIINNPAKPLNGNTSIQNPSVTFVMEDRVIMADGSELYIPAGNLVLNLDQETLTKRYPSIDAMTGEIDEDTTRYGGEIMQLIVKALEDVFITEGMLKDNIENRTEAE